LRPHGQLDRRLAHRRISTDQRDRFPGERGQIAPLVARLAADDEILERLQRLRHPTLLREDVLERLDGAIGSRLGLAEEQQRSRQIHLDRRQRLPQVVRARQRQALPRAAKRVARSRSDHGTCNGGFSTSSRRDATMARTYSPWARVCAIPRDLRIGSRANRNPGANG
jgi:hypothetical protein